ncbi:MAG: GumC family protein, partial [Bacteriovoracia bacterium]
MSDNIQKQYNDENSFEELSLEDILYLFKKRFLLFFMVVIAVVAITFGYLMVAVPIYQATVTIKVEPTEEGVALDDLFFGSGLSSRGDISTEIELIKSRTNLEKVVDNLYLDEILVHSNDDKLQLTEVEKKKRAVRVLKEMVSVSVVKDTKIVSISVESKYKDLTDDIANELASVYNQQLTEMAKKALSTKRAFLEKQLPETKRELQSIIENVKSFKEETGIFILSEEGSYLLEMITTHDKQIDDIKMKIQTTLNSINFNKDKI